MFTAVARLCARNAGTVAGYRPRLPARRSPLRPPPPPPRASGLLAAAPGAPDGRPGALTTGGEADPPEDRVSFGSLSADMASRRLFKKSGPAWQELRYVEDQEDQEDQEDREDREDRERPRRRPGRSNTPYWYFLQCKKLIKENKLQEALEMFSRDMLQEERLQPLEFNYSVLMGGCGRAGRLKEAFRLYNDMKKRGLEAGDATYTALFNACAETPSKQAGLQRALKLEQELRRKNIPLSTITYHALLKTHAVTNHLRACLHTFREMLQNGHVVTQETFHYLLMGCLKDREIGFRLALQVWRQMLRSGIRPDTKNYNLLLRTARDCGVGDPAVASDLLLRPEAERPSGRPHAETHRKAAIDVDLLEKQLFVQHGRGSGEDGSPEGRPAHLVPARPQETSLVPFVEAPSLLDLFEGKGGGVVSFGALSGASDRLALIGGGKGFLEKMAAQGLAPDLRTLTLLADTLEPGRRSLQMLLKVAKQHELKLDAAFFNSAVRRASRAGDLETAKSVLGVMRQRNVAVDARTFGSLALGCQRQEEGLQLLEDMQKAGFKPNVHVFSALVGRAARRLDYVYLKRILKSMQDTGVKPNEVLIRQLEFAAQYPPNYDQYKSRNNYLVHIDGFRGYYQQWLQAMPAQDGEDEEAAAAAALPELKGEAADGLTEAERNQRAAARRYRPRSKASKASEASEGGAAAALELHG